MRNRYFPGTEVLRRVFPAALAAVLGSGLAVFATDLNVSLEAEGCQSSTITIGPACATPYLAVAELSDGASDGLALVVFDLEFEGGVLAQADTPTELPMQSFAPPAGLSNPAGYGGTPIGGKLVQVGGAQNVLVHGQWDCESDDDCPDPSTCIDEVCSAVAGLPLGTVVIGVAQAGAPVPVVTGTLTTPAAPGTYELQLTGLTGNVIDKGAFGLPFWRNEVAGVGTVVDLSITVEAGAVCCDVYESCCVPGGACAGAPPEECAALGGTSLGPEPVCERDADGDGVDALCGDECPADPYKTEPGVCGCGVLDDDTDFDTVPDCIDECPEQDDLLDEDGNGVPDCLSPPAEPVPAVRGWGLVVITALFLSLYTWYLGRRDFLRRKRVP